jgi:two-component system cell cycle response regulator DivK
MSKSKTILLVEDYESFRVSLKQLLELENYEVVEAESGESALEKLSQTNPDLILLDLTLPGIDGVTTAKKIREIDVLKSVPIIALSALDAEDFGEEVISAGCNDYLVKPIDFDRLINLLTKYIK